jgi:hypothetical protein
VADNYTVTLTIETDDFINDEGAAQTFAQMVTEMLIKAKRPLIKDITYKTRPNPRTRAYPGEVHPDCGQMVAYGESLLHKC